MYGMVNEGIRKFIEGNHGKETWKAICQKASIDVQQFERMASYDDKITYGLVGAICEHTELTAEEVLNVFGQYWVGYAKASAFGNLLQLAGETFVERIEGLDEMHDRILLSMPHLKPPSFDIEEVGEKTYDLHYFSEREGLASFVVGLLHGLAAETDETISVEHVTQRSEASDHDVFRVTLLD